MTTINPKVSAFCCTYGRPHLLNEAVYSFLAQDYQGDKELIILNDHQKQRIVFNHPQVKVFNSNDRFDNLAYKHNVAVSLCSGELITPWDDDDIRLSWSLRVQVRNMRNGVSKTESAWVDDDPENPSLCLGQFHGTHMFTKDRFISCNGYQLDGDTTYDMRLMAYLNNYAGERSPEELNPEGPFYLMRKLSIDTYHCTEIGIKNPRLLSRVDEKVGEVEEGDVVLLPQWSRDWEGIVNRTKLLRKKHRPIWEVDKTFRNPENQKKRRRSGGAK